MIILVRHAHAGWSRDEDRPLTARGLADAEALALELAPCRIEHIYSSPLRRARQTIEPLQRRLGVPLELVEDLRERRLPTTELEEFEIASRQTRLDFDYDFPGGESNRAAQKRGVAVVNQLRGKHPTETFAIASHGTLISLILAHFDPSIGYEFWCSLRLPDAFALEQDDACWRVRRLLES